MKTASSASGQRQVPIPPRSLVRLAKLWPHARRKDHEIGEIRRIGYYSRKDGLDYVWLVDDRGEYNWASDHRWLFEHFEVIEYSTEKDFFGLRRKPLGPRFGAAGKEKAKPGLRAKATRR